MKNGRNIKQDLKNLQIPVIAAPMFIVSSPKLVIECCKNGIVGSFPAHSPRTREDFESWLIQVSDYYQEHPEVPYAVNLVVHHTNPRYEGDFELCYKHEVPIIITSKGAPTDICKKVHEYGGLVFHDVASKRHAEKAAEAGVDGIIAVAGGAGGHTGTLNPFALINEIKQVTDKPIILGGSITKGKDVLAAQAMGASFAYMGTRFINTKESNATDEYRQSIINSVGTDILLTAALDGAPANWIKSSLESVGVNITDLINTPVGQLYQAERLKGRYLSVFSAGHGVGSIHEVLSTKDLIQELYEDYQKGKDDLLKKIHNNENQGIS